MDKWTNIENMPKEYGFYLTCYSKGDYIRYEVAQLYKRLDGTFIFTDYDDTSSVDATHWMELPKKPLI